MTPLEMITKYELMKDRLEKEYKEHPPGQLNTPINFIDGILKDLRSTMVQPSWVTIRDKILKKIDSELTHEHYDLVHTLAQTLRVLPE